MAQQSMQVRKPNAPLVELFRANKKTIEGALMSGMDKDRFIRSAWIQMTENPDLAQCDPTSIIRALVKCGQQGLYPDGVNGYAYLVPFASKKSNKKLCTYIRGYKGLVALFAANPNAANLPLVCESVREGDYFVWTLGANPTIEHRPSLESRGDITHVYAVFRFKDGSMYPKVLSYAEAKFYEKFAKTKTFWNDFEEDMLKKTVIKQGAKLMPLADHVRGAMAFDDALESGDDSIAETLAAIDIEEELSNGQLQAPKALPKSRAGECAKCKKTFEASALMDGLCSPCSDKGNAA